MYYPIQLKKKLDYVRFVHLAVIFMIAIFLFLFTNIPEKKWMLLTVLVVSAGVEPGLIVRRSRHRMKGTLAALLILIPLIYFLQLNYRLIPVFFTLAIVGLSVTYLNANRYDISVFFITLTAFLLLAQTTDANSPQGPFEMVINRGSCTLLGIVIVLTGEYFLFQSYRYSHKLYLFHQMIVYNFFKEVQQKINNCQAQDVNTFLFLEHTRDEVIRHFAPIIVSSENLKLEKKTSEQTRQQIENFQKTIWDLRRLLFALCISKFVLKSTEATEKNQQQFKVLMSKARSNFIRW